MKNTCILLMSLIGVFMSSMARAQAPKDHPLSKAALILKQTRPLLDSALSVVQLEPIKPANRIERANDKDGTGGNREADQRIYFMEYMTFYNNGSAVGKEWFREGDGVDREDGWKKKPTTLKHARELRDQFRASLTIGTPKFRIVDINGRVVETSATNDTPKATREAAKNDPMKGMWAADCGSFSFSNGRFTHVCSGTPLEGGYQLNKGQIELSFDNGTSIIGTLKDGRVDGTMNNPKRGTSKAFTFTKR